MKKSHSTLILYITNYYFSLTFDHVCALILIPKYDDNIPVLLIDGNYVLKLQLCACISSRSGLQYKPLSNVRYFLIKSRIHFNSFENCRDSDHFILTKLMTIPN